MRTSFRGGQLYRGAMFIGSLVANIFVGPVKDDGVTPISEKELDETIESITGEEPVKTREGVHKLFDGLAAIVSGWMAYCSFAILWAKMSGYKYLYGVAIWDVSGVAMGIFGGVFLLLAIMSARRSMSLRWPDVLRFNFRKKEKRDLTPEPATRSERTAVV